MKVDIIETLTNKLLKIGLDNQNINFRETKTSTVKINYDLNAFLDSVEKKKSIYFEASKNDIKPILNEGPKHIILPAVGSKEEQSRILKNLSRKHATFIEENNINILYLAVGFVRWTEEDKFQTEHYAPLLFLPVKLIQKSIKSQFELLIEESNFIENLAFIKKIKKESSFDFSLIDKHHLENLSLAKYYEEYSKLFKKHLPNQKWTIVNDCYLSIFTDQNLYIINDIEQNQEKFLNNDFVKLIFGESANLEKFDFKDLSDKQVDLKLDPNKYWHFLPADISQEKAIQYAIDGKSYVLQGPPGTGKSQTIINIITELIARNKKVLFVSEKQAALDVVYNKLHSNGLSDFVLAIHKISDRNKKDIINDLHNSLENSRIISEVKQDFTETVKNSYTSAKEKLINYGELLLEIYQPLKVNLYQLIGRYFNLKKAQELIFKIHNISAIDDNLLNKIVLGIKKYEFSLKEIDYNSKNNPWYGFKNTTITNNQTNTLGNHFETVIQNFDPVMEEEFIKELHEFEKFIYLINLDWKSHTLNIEEDLRLLDYKNIKQHENEELKKELLKIFKTTVFNLDFSKYKDFEIKFRSSLKRIVSSEYSKLKNDLYDNRLDGNAKFSHERLVELAKMIEQIVLNEEKIKECIDKLSFVVPSKFDYEYTLQSLRWVFFHKNFPHIKNTILYKKSLPESKFETFINNSNDLLASLKEIQSNFDLSLINFYELPKEQVKKQFKSLLVQVYKNTLPIYINFLKSKKELLDLKLNDFIEKTDSKRIYKNLEDIFLRQFYKLLITDLNTKVNHTLGVKNDLVKLYKEEESKLEEIAIFKIKNNIKNSIIKTDANYEVSILKKEANKKNKFMPLRMLFSRIGNLITDIKPCLMMSPLSVSSYLKDTPVQFDAVIFDEASQVKPEFALASIVRGKQIIICGDKEQLPPTSFFERIGEDDTEYNENYEVTNLNDYDSILDVASSFLKTISLQNHYRSLNENLIYASNKEIYKNLISFPSNDLAQAKEALVYHKVNGIYKNSTNQIESDVVVNLVISLFKKYKDTKRIGVITCNISQQLLIEKKLYQQAANQIGIERYINNKDLFFIKNIETVQGDECDIAILNTIYGPGPDGIMRMSFGPINQANGYRRLNVAITRAREQMHIVTSIHGSDIIVDDSTSRGVKLLRNYLNLAEHGIDSKYDSLMNNSLFNEDFETEVYNELVKKGYSVQRKIGNSDFRIDLAVFDKENPDRFICGIECDGSKYLSSLSTRERDRVREMILNSRGWKLYRVWSADWFNNKDSELKKLVRFIEKAQNGQIANETQEINKAKSSIMQNLDETVIEQDLINSIFEEFPRYWNIKSDAFYTFYKEMYDPQNDSLPFDDKDIRMSILVDIINKYAPLHVRTLKQILASLPKKDFIEQPLKINKWLKDVLLDIPNEDDFKLGINNQNNIYLKENFFYVDNKEIKFRKNNIEYLETRKSNEFAPEEIQDFVYQTIIKSKVISLLGLHELFIELVGIKTVSPAIKKQIDLAVENLKVAGLIIENDEGVFSSSI
ncbi:hypothetical protein VO56_01375 [Mycoplasmopsis gallinacea]|uniref:DNA helicase n=1 Tax=Mycoplasmopsis gallinacea TaxID=29556 RepID=A0A0D5ZJN5_9BACT|nr:hypothetical protein VO56_01375 [Mycoplasmopsis gallinacea]